MAVARSYRDGWLTSMMVDSLRDDSAELFLFRLGLKADKNGVYHAEPELLRTAVYPLQVPRRRLAEVTRLRDKCVKSGLLRYWTAADGRPYVQILKFGQRTPNEKPIHPLPPGDPDDTGQEHFDLPEPPMARKEVNRSKGRGARGAPAAPAPNSRADESEEAWITRLQTERPDIDIRRQLELAQAAKRKEGRELELGYFEDVWLPNCSKIYTGSANGRQEPAPDAEPEGWREWLVTNYPDCSPVKDGTVRTMPLAKLPVDIQRLAIKELNNAEAIA